MTTPRTLLSVAALSLGLLSAATAHAALVPALGGQVVNDTDLNITWLADANLAAINSFGLARNVDLGPNPGVTNYGPSIIYSGGTMTWGGALKWIAAMNVANYLGYNDWRLPSITDTGTPGCNNSYGGTDCGYNSIGSEMAHLYYSELGNLGYCDANGNCSQPGYGLAHTGPFRNLKPWYYWSGTEYSRNLKSTWVFNFSQGLQTAIGKDSGATYALAVRPGQVVATPLPGAAWLLGSGLIGLIRLGRRRLVLR